MEQVRLDPIRIGYPYELALTFPAGYLAANESVRAELRVTAEDDAELIEFGSARDGDIVTLSLTKAQTAALSAARAFTDLTIVSADGTAEYAITSPRFLIAIQQHGTRTNV